MAGIQLPGKEPFTFWEIDFVGSLVKTPRGSEYIIAAIDYATSKAFAMPLEITNATNLSLDKQALSMSFSDLMVAFGLERKGIVLISRTFIVYLSTSSRPLLAGYTLP
jgi:hypothetical protein